MTSDETSRSLTFRSLFDEPTGSGLAPVFQEYWPAYKRWIKKTKTSRGLDYRSKLSDYMPELMPVFDQLLDRFGGGKQIARFLSLYNPPRVVRGCSQIVLDDDGPVLIRSYDHHPDLIDALIVKSAWLDRDVLAISDCIWGALDGINEYGLTISLAFGGRDAIGPGFSAPLIIRYILETCSNVEEARSVLTRVPVYMPYTFLIVDKNGSFLTAYTGPDIQPRFISKRASANHQSQQDWPAYLRHTNSVERQHVLESLLESEFSVRHAVESFLRPPLWRTDYQHASGSLYVAEYRPAICSLKLHWPTQSKVFLLNRFEECELDIPLHTSTDPDESSHSDQS